MGGKGIICGLTAAAVGGLAAYAYISRNRKERASSPLEVVFVLGGPGSGKGTQCEKLVEEFGMAHLSAGDLLRAERNSGSETADLINGIIKEGKLVPSEITVGLLRDAIVKSDKRTFLVDGFPRNLENVEVWNKVVGDLCRIKFMLFLECPEKVMEERLVKRGETSGRVDDNVEAIRKRFNTYQEATMPIVERFREQGLVRQVVSDRSIDEVYAEVKALFV